MKFDREDLLLYAVTDSRWLNGERLYDQVEKALKGGATFIQLREKELDQEHFFEEAVEIKELCARYHVPFVINDNVEIALKMDADGVHVGQDDMEAGDVRAKLLAEERGADYLGVGAVFPTGSKTDVDVLDGGMIREITEAVHIPVIAIGGIGKDNVEKLAGNGLDGVAVISAIFAQKDITEATRELKEAVFRMVNA